MTADDLRRRALIAVPAPSAPSDWTGVVVGHWLARHADGRDKHGAQLFRCVSRCGVAHRLTASALAAGGPATCHGCRGGAAAPAAARVVAETDLPRHQLIWETPVNVRSNLKGKQAIGDWDEYGLPAVAGVLAATAYGADYGWVLFVRDCHERVRPKGESVVRVKSVHPGQRRIELLVRPVGGRYSFEVDLTTGRNEPFDAILAAVRTAAAAPREEEPTPPAAHANGHANGNGTHANGLAKAVVGVDLDRLLLIRSGIDRLHTAGTALKTVAEQKAAAAERLAEAEAAERAANEAVKETSLAVSRAGEERAALARQKDELAEKLARTVAALADAERAAAEAWAAQQAAAAALVPAADKAEYARLEYEDAQAAEDGHVRALAAGDEMAPLLAALAKLAAK